MKKYLHWCISTSSKMYKKYGTKYILILTGSITGLNVIIGALFLYLFEHNVDNALINSYSSALWMNWMVATTVGFGDYYPISTGGKIVTGISSAIGIGMFGLFTSVVSGILMEHTDDSIRNRELKEQNARIEIELNEVKKILVSFTKDKK
ncbi:coil containing protein [Vibrio phage 2.275.O._10N.286.54.E11]|nr:coil containing protein [Vibrio phage 2.275.O._10N.286.54.E11]